MISILFGKIKRIIVPILLEVSVRFNFSQIRQNKHNLNHPLIVSLTSYPKRYNKLHLTLKCLLRQSIKPDLLILWIAHDDFEQLPNNVLKLQQSGLKIKPCEDLKSYKKIIPTLYQYPNSFIVTADDDTFYQNNWLKELVEQHNEASPASICHRSRQITFKSNSNLEPYSTWRLIQNSIITNNNPNRKYIFPTGGGGVLYPPNIFHPEVMNEIAFSELCPNADDIWLYWMIRRNGGQSKTVRTDTVFYEWCGSDKYALFKTNLDNNENDHKIMSMMTNYPIKF